MACSFQGGFFVSGLNEAAFSSREIGVPGFCCSIGSSSINIPDQKEPPSLTAEFIGKQVPVSDRNDVSGDWSARSPASFLLPASGCVSRATRWWEKILKPNMAEINSAQELVSSLLCAGDHLVVVDFYSPGCGGCRALHPKISQLAELYPGAIFLKVNYDELRMMCRCLNIRVLPFFRFYRGTKGRVCSFSCTNATIKKFKDALMKHGSESCSIGPAKGLDDAELLRLVSCGEIPVNFRSPSKESRSLDFVLSNMGNIPEAISGISNKEEYHSLLNV